MQIYFKRFDSKKDLPFPAPNLNHVYEATQDGEHLMVRVEDQELALTPPVTDNEYFTCEVAVVQTMSFEQLTDMIQDHAAKVKADFEKKSDEVYDLVENITNTDATMVEPLHGLFTHINSTYNDKYQEPFPAIDITWLKWGGTKESTGFNVGTATTYLKRYMTDGFEKSRNINDLYKAIHFLLFEIYSRQTNIDGEINPDVNG